MQTSRPLSDYPLQSTMQVRFGDVDMNRHLNNVAQARLFEEGTAVLHRRALAERPPGRGIVAQHTLRYHAEGRYPGELKMGSGVARIGTSSYEVEHVLVQHGKAVSTCNTVVVWLDPDRRPMRLPDALRADLSVWAMRTDVEVL